MASLPLLSIPAGGDSSAATASTAFVAAALSTWGGSANLDTVGTITTGTWQGTAIADAYIASAATWDAKQAAGSYITALTGDVTASGPGSAAATIGAGVVTNAMLAGSIAASKLVGTDIVIAESQVTNLTTDLAAKSPLASPSFTGTPTAPTATTATNTTQVATTAYVKSQSYLTTTGNGSGLTGLTGAQISGNIAGNAANVTGTVAIANGGTGQITAQTARNALLPAQATNGGKFLTTDGADMSWAATVVGDQFAALANAPVSITGTTTLTSAAFGKLHVCTGTTSNYTVTLPAPSGNAGKLIGFRMAPALTKMITIARNSTESINGASSRIMHNSEAATLLCDGTDWFKIAGLSIPMACTMQKVGAQTIFSVSEATVTLDTIVSDTTGQMGDTATSRVNIIRGATYIVGATLVYRNMAACNNLQVIITKNGVTDKNTSISNNAGGYPTANAAYSVTLAAGDYLMVRAFHTTSDTELHVNDPNVLTVVEVPAW